MEPRESGLELIGDSGVETEALTPLRCAHADSAAIADFVFLIEEVDDIDAESERDFCPSLRSESGAPSRRLRGNRGHLAGIGEAGTEA